MIETHPVRRAKQLLRHRGFRPPAPVLLAASSVRPSVRSLRATGHLAFIIVLLETRLCCW